MSITKRIKKLFICFLLSTLLVCNVSSSYNQAQASIGFLMTLGEVAGTIGVGTIASIVLPIILIGGATYAAIELYDNRDIIASKFKELIGSEDMTQEEVEALGTDEKLVHEFIYNDVASQTNSDRLAIPKSIIEASSRILALQRSNLEQELNYSTKSILKSYDELMNSSLIGQSGTSLERYEIAQRIMSNHGENSAYQIHRAYASYDMVFNSVNTEGRNNIIRAYSSNYDRLLYCNDVELQTLTIGEIVNINRNIPITQYWIGTNNEVRELSKTAFEAFTLTTDGGKYNEELGYLGSAYPIDLYGNSDMKLYIVTDNELQNAYTIQQLIDAGRVQTFGESKTVTSIMDIPEDVTMEFNQENEYVIPLTQEAVANINGLMVDTGVITDVPDGVKVNEDVTAKEFVETNEKAYSEFGDVITDGITVDVEKGFWQYLTDVLTDVLEWLFVPDAAFIDEFLVSTVYALEEANSILTYPLGVLTKFVDRLFNMSTSDCIFHIPELKVQGKILYKGMDYNVTQAIKRSQTLSEVYTYYIKFTDFMMIIGLIELIRRKYEEITKSNTVIE